MKLTPAEGDELYRQSCLALSKARAAMMHLESSVPRDDHTLRALTLILAVVSELEELEARLWVLLAGPMGNPSAS